MSAESERVVRLGAISGVYGVKGWVKVHSFTEPRENLFDYPDWMLETPDGPRAVSVDDARVNGKTLVVKLAGVDDRDVAAELIGATIAVSRSALPECAPGEYYWADLEGLEVTTTAGDTLGRVERLVATGANDVLVLDGGQMIPYLAGQVVRKVDLEAGRIVVDWHPAYWE